MSSKSDFIPAARGPHLIQQSRKFPVVKFTLNAGQALLTIFAVLGGWTGSILAGAALALWVAIPVTIGQRVFRRKDF